MSKQSPPKVNWQPISALPLIATLIDGLLEEAEQQYENLQSCRPQPHVLDDYTVGRVIKVYTEQADDVGLYVAAHKHKSQDPITSAFSAHIR